MTLAVHGVMEAAESVKVGTADNGQKVIHRLVDDLQRSSATLFNRISEMATNVKEWLDAFTKLKENIGDEQRWLDNVKKKLRSDDEILLKPTLEAKKLHLQSLRVQYYCYLQYIIR